MEAIKKIVLSKQHIEVIEQHMAGKITMFGASQKDRELLSDIMEAAEDLMIELKEFEQESLIEWYYDKYKNQQQQSNPRANNNTT
jgi:hypothetical protein